ncbi:MAG: MMPL family transporter, partial [Pirellulales bacterium]|nr:MMPL family transporter [Pirellulales bacterium]
MSYESLGRLISRRWVLVLVVWTVLVALLHHWAPRWDDVTYDGDFAYLPDTMTSVRGERRLEAAFPDYFSRSQVAFVLARTDGPLGEADYDVGQRLLDLFPPSEDPADPVSDVWSYETPIVGTKLVSPETERGQAALIVLHLRNEFMAIDNMNLFRKKILPTLAKLSKEPDFPPGLKLGVTGSAAIGYDMLDSAEQSIHNTELTTIAMVVGILLLVYRAPGLVIVPLITIGASVLVAMDLVATLAHLASLVDWIDFKIFKTTRIFVVVILFGAGTDYCLFLIARYKEELQRGLSPPEAIAAALTNVGSALAASALTTIVGLGMMFFSDFGKFRNSGPAIALCLVVALAASMTLAPAILRSIGRAVFWPFGIRSAESESELADHSWASGFWRRLAGMILARPGLILVVSLLIMLPLTHPFRVLCMNLAGSAPPSGEARPWSVPVSYDLLNELQHDAPSVQGTHLLWRYFPADQTGPVTVLVKKNGADFESEEGRRQIGLLTEELFDLVYTDTEGNEVQPIVSVRSRTEPLGGEPGGFNPLTEAGRHKMAALGHPKTKAAFVTQQPGMAGEVTRFDLVCQYKPFSPESIRLFEAVERRLLDKANDPKSFWYDAEFDFVGTTAGIRDLEKVTSSDRILIQVLVVLAVLGVLVAILRHPMICIYLILSVLLGYYVTIGTTELFFSWLGGDSFTGLDWKVPIFLFVILIAVG